MKKLLQINVCVNMKSTGRIVEQLSVLAQRAGFETYAAGVDIQEPSCSTLYVIKNDLSRFSHRVITRFLDMQGRGSSCSTRQLIKWIERVQPDIIHLHNLHCAYLNYPLLFQFLKIYGKPVVWTLHDCWPFTGHCAHFDAISCEKWKTGCGTCLQIPPFCLDQSAENYATKKTCFTSLSNFTLVPVSDWMAKNITLSFFKRKRYVIIRNGIDLSCFKLYDKKQARVELGLNENTFILLAASSVWNAEKGLQEIIKLSNNSDFQLVMLGVPAFLSEKLPKTIEARPLIADPALLAKYYSAADVFVNPTYNDTFPTVNLEAQACGTPVVCYQSGGAPDTLSSATGIVVPRGDYEALEKAIYSIKNKEFAPSQQVCREWAETQFDKEQNFQKYITLYNSLL